MALVLVIDDDDGIRHMLDLALTSHGHEVITAASGAAGLASIEERSPDVILLDLNVRSGDARLVHALSGRGPARIILMSAAETLASEAGPAHRWLAKPFDLADLLRLVEEGSSQPN